MIVIVNDQILCQESPQDVFILHCLSMMGIIRMELISLIHNDIGTFLEYLNTQKHDLNCNYSSGDYLAGKVGPKKWREVIWKHGKVGPAWIINMEKYQHVPSASSNSTNQNPVFKPVGMHWSFNEEMKLTNTFNTIKNMKYYFKIPRQLQALPYKSVKRSLRVALKYGKKVERFYQNETANFYWVLDHLILNEYQTCQIKSQINELIHNEIMFPFEDVFKCLVQLESTILNMRSSRFLKDSLPNSDLARYCLLVKNDMFFNNDYLRRNLNQFWKQVCDNWSKLTERERGRKMLNSNGMVRSWADDDEMKLFVGSSESDEEIIDWNQYGSDDEDEDHDDELKETAETEYDLDYDLGDVKPDWDSNLSSSLDLIKEVEDETMCEFNTTVVKTEEEEEEEEEEEGDADDDEKEEGEGHDRKQEDQEHTGKETNKEDVYILHEDATIELSNAADICMQNAILPEKLTSAEAPVYKELPTTEDITVIEGNDLITETAQKSLQEETSVESFNQSYDPLEVETLVEVKSTQPSAVSITSVEHILDECLADDDQEYDDSIGSINEASTTADTELSSSQQQNNHHALDLTKPGALTLLLDSPSSVSSNISRSVSSSDDEYQHQTHQKISLSLPEKIDKYEKLSGVTRKSSRNFSIRKLSPSSPLAVESSSSSYEYDFDNHGHHHHNTEDERVDMVQQNQSNPLKRVLKPVVKRAPPGSVNELKKLVNLRPIGISSGSNSNSDISCAGSPLNLTPTNSRVSEFVEPLERKKMNKQSHKRSISSIFSALLDDNMRDLATSAEYKNKIVKPEDLYNRIKISSDKPWNVLSSRTKEKYYHAFLRKYSFSINHPGKEVIEVQDVVELVRVCASFDDWKKPIFKYALRLVDSVESRDNSEVDSM